MHIKYSAFIIIFRYVYFTLLSFKIVMSCIIWKIMIQIFCYNKLSSNWTLTFNILANTDLKWYFLLLMKISQLLKLKIFNDFYHNYLARHNNLAPSFKSTKIFTYIWRSLVWSIVLTRNDWTTPNFIIRQPLLSSIKVLHEDKEIFPLFDKHHQIP